MVRVMGKTWGLGEGDWGRMEEEMRQQGEERWTQLRWVVELELRKEREWMRGVDEDLEERE